MDQTLERDGFIITSLDEIADKIHTNSLWNELAGIKEIVKGETVMTNVFNAVLIIAVSCPVFCFASSPVSKARQHH